MGNVLSYMDVVQKFEDAYHKCIIIVVKHSYGDSLIITEELECSDIGNKFSITDLHDTQITINKSCIQSVCLEHEVLNEEIVFDLGSSKITFIIGN